MHGNSLHVSGEAEERTLGTPLIGETPDAD
jgi:hypothetical protein